MRKYLNYGMVGGDLDAFIGSVHRTAATFDGRAILTAGCFSRNAQKNKDCGDFYRVDRCRIYDSYEAMAEAEGQRDDGIDFVVIVTPNNTHYPVACAFLKQGIHVLCEKPLCFTEAEAQQLKALAQAAGVYFGVNYSYSGTNMVKEARELVRSGAIGRIINVNAEYLQEYLVDDVGSGDPMMVKLSSWRKDPDIAGISNCVGDIGSHIEHTVAYITGLRPKRVAAVLDDFGQPLDLNANILVEFDNGAHGVFSSSQVCVGHMNGLVVRIFGTEGAVEWRQEKPDELYVTTKGRPTQIYNRGMGYVSARSAQLNRLPSGHPEGLFAAFANIYQSYISAVLKKVNGEAPGPGDLDFPTIDDGIAGVKFIHACVESSRNDSVWTMV